MAQMGFFDLSDRYASLDAKKDPLVEIDAVVPWEEFRPLLEQIWRKPESERKSRAGRKPMDAVLMFKTLVLGALYNLSDDQIEYQISDRLSFMRFLGLGLGDRVPDAKTVWLCPEALAQAGKVDDLFKMFDRHLARQTAIIDVAKGDNMLDRIWSCHACVPASQLIYAAFRSNAKGLLPPKAFPVHVEAYPAALK
jgi:hypothetical protein